MNENLSIKLYDACRIAYERECANRDYQGKVAYLKSRKAEADRVPILKRIWYMIIASIMFYGGGFLLDLTDYAGKEFADFDMLQKSFAIMAWGGFVLGIVLQIAAKFLHQHSIRYKAKCKAIEEERKELDRMHKEELQKINSKQGAYVPGLPYRYHTTQTLTRMQEYVGYGVNTIKDLIQRYDEECHRGYVENMQEQIMSEVQGQAERLNYLTSMVWHS